MGEVREQPGEIIVALKFDANADNLVRAAVTLARISHRPLRLVHVMAPEPPTFGAFEGAASLAAGEGELPAERGEGPNLAAARQQLRQLTQGYAVGDVDLNVSVLIGDFPATIIEFATARQASLLITGAALRRPGRLRSKLRQTYRLMAQTTIPLLVLPDSHPGLAMDSRPLRFLVADDLTPRCLPVLSATEDLVDLLGTPAAVLHLHVQPAPGAGLPVVSPEDMWPGLSVHDRLVNDHHDRLAQRLTARAKELAARVAALGGSYATELWHGNVAEEICRAAQVHAADISVFGRHQFLHWGPLALGQMPFAAMLDVDSAILVAAPPTPAESATASP